MTAPESEPGARLERALELFLSHSESGSVDPGALLERHDDLRDLLEPMVSDHGEGGAAATDARAAAAPAGEGRVLGDFRILRELGRGGMGIVYAAWQRSLDRRVALKVLAPQLVSSPASMARFRREAAAAGRLHHPGIVEVYDFGSAGDEHYFAMALVDGLPLHRCADRFRTAAAAVELVAQVVDALQHAHAAGLVHRDVKPANILVRADDRAVLTDFGLASDAELPSMTREGSFVGTLDYAAPEQVHGAPIDARVDVWAAGVVLWELLAGGHPFAAGTPQATMHRILTADPPDLRRRNPAVGSDLAAVVTRALEKDPGRRYLTAAAFLADLRAVQQGGSVSARLSSPGARLMRWTRREPWRAAALGLLLAGVPVVAAGLGYLSAKAPLIAAAEREAARQAREDALGAAWLAYAEGETDAALAAIQGAGLPADDVEAAVARAATLWAREDRVGAEAALAQVRTQPVPERLLAWMQVADRERGSFRLPAPDTLADAFECFAVGVMAFEQARLDPDDDSRFRAVAQLFGRATVLAPAPRAPFLGMWLRAASLADDRQVAALAREALQRHFGDRQFVRSHLGMALAMMDPQQAVPLLRQRLADVGNSASVRFNLGLALEKTEQWAEAEEHYRACVALDARHQRAWNNLGMVLRRKRDQQGAEAAFRKAVEVAPRHSKAWNNLGITLRALGRPDEARAALERALQIRPDYAIAHFNLGNLLLQTGDREGAIAAFRHAVQHDPLYARAWANLGNALRDYGRREDALMAYERAVALAPRDLIPIYNVARTALDLGLRQRARAAAQTATEVAPDMAEAWSILAEVLLKAPELDDGVRVRAAAARADELAKGANPELRLLLAQAEVAVGEREAALARLRELHATLADRADQAALRDKVATLLRQLEQQ